MRVRGSAMLVMAVVVLAALWSETSSAPALAQLPPTPQSTARVLPLIAPATLPTNAVRSPPAAVGDQFAFRFLIMNGSTSAIGETIVAMEPSVPMDSIPPSCSREGGQLRYLCRVRALGPLESVADPFGGEIDRSGAATGPSPPLGTAVEPGALRLVVQALPNGRREEAEFTVLPLPVAGSMFNYYSGRRSFAVRRPGAGAFSKPPEPRVHLPFGSTITPIGTGTAVQYVPAPGARPAVVNISGGQSGVRIRQVGAPPTLEFRVTRARSYAPWIAVTRAEGRVRVRARYVDASPRGGGESFWKVEDGRGTSRVELLKGRVAVRDRRRGTTRVMRLPQCALEISRTGAPRLFKLGRGRGGITRCLRSK